MCVSNWYSKLLCILNFDKLAAQAKPSQIKSGQTLSVIRTKDLKRFNVLVAALQIIIRENKLGVTQSGFVRRMR